MMGKQGVLSCFALTLMALSPTASIGAEAVKDDNGALLRNGKIEVGFDAKNDWNMTLLRREGGPNLVGKVKLLEFLEPTAVEIKSVPGEVSAKSDAGGASVTINRESPFFTVRQVVTVADGSDKAVVDIELSMRKTAQVGVVRLPIVEGSPSAKALLWPDEETGMLKADTAALLNDVGANADSWAGMLDADGSGFLLVAPGNRARLDGKFIPLNRAPGSFSFDFQMKRGPFGELVFVGASHKLKFSYELLLFKDNPEKSLADSYPGSFSAQEKRPGVDARIRTFVEQTLHKDDGVLELGGGQPECLKFLFYRRGREEVDSKGLDLVLDLPKDIRLKRAVIFNYWVPRMLMTEFPTEKTTDGGAEYVRHRIPFREPITFRADKSLFDSHKHHQLYLMLETDDVSKDTPFTYRWRLESPSGDGALHAEKGVVLKFTPPAAAPKRFALWGDEVREMSWAGAAEVDKYVALFKALGFSALPHMNDKPYMKLQVPNLNDKLRAAGFKIIAADLLSPLRILAEKNLKNPEPGSVWKTITGEVGYKGNNPQQSFCPTWLLKPDRSGIKAMEKYFEDVSKHADFIYSDWEGKTWQGCYCDECLAAFAKFSGMDADMISKTPPEELVRKNTVKWYGFRNWQTGEMHRVYREMLQKIRPEIKVGCDFALVNVNCLYEGLGRGIDLFCDDPRLMKNAKLDFGAPDTLFSGVRSYDDFAVIASEIRDIPLQCKTGSIGGLGFFAGSWVSRRMEAEFQKTPLGIDFQPRLTRLMALGFAANGAAGATVNGMPFTGRTMVEFAKLAEQLAAVEDYYLDGTPCAEKAKLLDLSIKEPKRDYENSVANIWLFMGRPWEDLVRFRAHSRDGAVLCSLFNFDIIQERILHVAPSLDGDAPRVVYDPVSKTGLLSPSGKKQWSAAELAAGLLMRAAPVEAAFLVVAPADQEKSVAKWEEQKTGGAAPKEKGLKPRAPWVKQGRWTEIVDIGVTRAKLDMKGN